MQATKGNTIARMATNTDFTGTAEKCPGTHAATRENVLFFAHIQIISGIKCSSLSIHNLRSISCYSLTHLCTLKWQKLLQPEAFHSYLTRILATGLHLRPHWKRTLSWLGQGQPFHIGHPPYRVVPAPAN